MRALAMTLSLEQQADKAVHTGDFAAAEVLYTDAVEEHQKQYGVKKTLELSSLYLKLASVMEAQGKDASSVRRIAEIMKSSQRE